MIPETIKENTDGGLPYAPCSRSFVSLETPLADKYICGRNALGFNVAADDAAFIRAMEQTYNKWRNRCAYAEQNLKNIIESHARCAIRLKKLMPAATAVVERWETLMWKDVPATAVVINALRDALNYPENDQVGTDGGMPCK